jgi:uncharacterized membrane protein
VTDRRLAYAIAVLGLIGLGIASYLTYVHYEGLKAVCFASGCETVQSSRYAKVAGIPVPVLGLVGYVSILGSLLVRGETGLFAGVLIALIGFGFSLYLTYLELFKIHAICQWCVGSAVVMALLAIVTVGRLMLAGPGSLQETQAPSLPSGDGQSDG